MSSETFELLGDIESLKEPKNYEQAVEFYKEASAAKPDKISIYIKIG